jgi:hypothetical protein
MLLAVAALEGGEGRGGVGGGTVAVAAAAAAARVCNNTKTCESIYNSLFMLSGNTSAGRVTFQTKYSFEV